MKRLGQWILAKLGYAPSAPRCVDSTSDAGSVTTQPTQVPPSALTSPSSESPVKKPKVTPRPSTANAWILIKKWEGFKAAPYKCPANVWTIGYGITVYPDGQKVEERSPDVTEAQASKFLVQYIQKYIEPALTREVGDLVNQNQYDALVSFIYNVGMGAFEKSTMLKCIKARMFEAAAAEFPRWNKAGGKVLAGLIARRKDEKALFERDPWVD